MREGRFIPNPCDHIMFDHLRYRSVRVEPRGPAGNQAEKILMLNDDESVNYRELILGLIALVEEKKRQLEQTMRRIDGLLRSSTGKEDQLRNKKRETETAYTTILQHLSMLGAVD